MIKKIVSLLIFLSNSSKIIFSDPALVIISAGLLTSAREGEESEQVHLIELRGGHS
jgi:hypothetical protein